jgi:hypothetical protein
VSTRKTDGHCGLDTSSAECDAGLVGETVGFAVSLIALAGAALAGARYAAHVYAQTLGSRRVLEEKLHQIGPGVTTRHVEALLGPAVYSRRARMGHDPPGILDASFESIYLTRHAYVQIVHDEHGEVLAFGITTTDPDFHPTVPQLPPIATQRGDVRIGRTRFGELDPDINPMLIWLHMGPYKAHYNEVHSFGRSGRYLTFGLARNEAGIGSWGSVDGELSNLNFCDAAALNDLPDSQKRALQHFRDGTTINTVCVYSDRVTPDAVLNSNEWRFGLDSEATPDLLKNQRGPVRRIRDRLAGHRRASQVKSIMDPYARGSEFSRR